MYVLDSSSIIEVIKKNKKGEEIQEICRGQSVVTTSICMFEILSGSKSEKEFFLLSNLFKGFIILFHDIDSSIDSSKILLELKRNGNMINDMDILIAGICKANNTTLITLDKDFEKVNGLDVKIVK